MRFSVVCVFTRLCFILRKYDDFGKIFFLFKGDAHLWSEYFSLCEILIEKCTLSTLRALRFNLKPNKKGDEICSSICFILKILHEIISHIRVSLHIKTLNDNLFN